MIEFVKLLIVCTSGDWFLRPEFTLHTGNFIQTVPDLEERSVCYPIMLLQSVSFTKYGSWFRTFSSCSTELLRKDRRVHSLIFFMLQLWEKAKVLDIPWRKLYHSIEIGTYDGDYVQAGKNGNIMFPPEYVFKYLKCCRSSNYSSMYQRSVVCILNESFNQNWTDTVFFRPIHLQSPHTFCQCCRSEVFDFHIWQY